MFRTLLALAACAALVPAIFAAEPKAPAAPVAKPVKIGVEKLDGKEIRFSRVGNIVAGKELTLQVGLPANLAPPKSVTLWLTWGNKTTGAGASEKVQAALKDGVYAANVKVPAQTDLDKGVTIQMVMVPATGKPVERYLGLQ